MKNLCYLLMLSVAFMSAESSFAQIISGTYAIKNVQTGMVLRIKDANKTDGTALVSYSPVNWKCVTWDFKHVEGQTYQLKNLFTGKTFQSVNAAAPEGAALQQQPLALNEVQEYEFLPAEDNHYLIRLKGTALYVTPSDAGGAENTGITLEKKYGGRLQQWTIYAQKPTM